jgi:hypothetical protein
MSYLEMLKILRKIMKWVARLKERLRSGSSNSGELTQRPSVPGKPGRG